MVNAVPLDDVFQTESPQRPPTAVLPKRPAAPDLDQDVEFTKIIRPTHFARHSPAPAAKAAELTVPEKKYNARAPPDPEPSPRKQSEAVTAKAISSSDSGNDTTTTVIVAVLFAASTILVLMYMHFYIGQTVNEIETTVKASYSMLNAMPR